MTRNEFIDEITNFGELINVCVEYGCEHLVEDIFDEDGMCEDIEDDIYELGRGELCWAELRDVLADIPTGYDYYYREGRFEWNGLTDGDFDHTKRQVMEFIDDGEGWDSEDDEPEEETDVVDNTEEVDDEEDDFVFEEEDMSIGDLMGICNSQLQRIVCDDETVTQEEEELFLNAILGRN